MSYKEFFTAEKVQELVDCIKEAGSRKYGLANFAKKYGFNEGGLRTYFYNHLITPELDRELPRAGDEPANKKRFKDEQHEGSATVEQALSELGKTELTKEDIENIAKKTGIHYHKALSVWASMHSRDRESPEENNCTGSVVCRWLFAELFASLIESGVSVAKVAERYKVSQAYVCEMAKTYKAFPEKEGRKYGLDFTYYRLASGAKTGTPHEWMQKAKENGWSTREFDAAIDGKPVETSASLKQENASLKSQLDEARSRLTEKEEKIAALEKRLADVSAELDAIKFRSAAASVIAEDKLVPSDINRAIERTGLDAKKVEDAIWKILNLPEYAVWRETLCTLKREIRLLKAKEVGKVADDSREVVLTKEQAECLPTVGHILGLYEKIAAQEEKIRVLRRLNLVYLSALRKKNTKLREKIVNLSTQNVHQEQNAQVH
ncbi:MAG: hypothetical protein K6T65_01430 [Peptococcaceae bacterium]|nr:hypothetical protein [Peptococcaceae bacterium]